MSHYTQQEFDFISRTKQIISQYEQTGLIKESEKFEATLLINSLVGLLILPQQHWYDTLPHDVISKSSWGIGEDDILFLKEGEDKSAGNVARHLRNSIAHYNFDAFNDGGGVIDGFLFQDFTPSPAKNKVFEAKVLVSDLKTFVYKLTDVLIEQMKNQKPK